MLIGFCAGKGAPGATTAVANIGVALAADNRSVLAVDLDPAGGVLSAHLGGDPTRGLWPLIRAGQAGDADQLGAQTQLLHGLQVIAGFPRAADAARVELVAIATAARGLAEVVLVDLGRLPGDGAEVAEICERIVVVAAAEPVGILAAEQALVALSESAAERVSVLVSGVAYPAEAAQVAGLLAVPLLGSIPWAPDELRRSHQRQVPASGRAGKAFARLAEALAPLKYVPAAERGRLQGLAADGS